MVIVVTMLQMRVQIFVHEQKYLISKTKKKWTRKNYKHCKKERKSIMLKSSAMRIQLRGANPTITSSKSKKNTTLKHTKLLTKMLKEKFRIKYTQPKYHYESVDEVISHFEHFFLMFMTKKKK